MLTRECGARGLGFVPGTARPAFLLVCACCVRAVFLWRAVGLLFSWVRGSLAWVFLSCFCSRIRMRARACLFVLCGV